MSTCGIVPDRVVVLVVVDILRVYSVAQSEFVRFVGMAADQSHHLGFFTLRERGQDLIDGEAAQSHDGPAHFLPRRLRHRYRGSALHKRPRKVGRYQSLPNLGDESAASDFPGERIGHGAGSLGFCWTDDQRGDSLPALAVGLLWKILRWASHSVEGSGQTKERSTTKDTKAH